MKKMDKKWVVLCSTAVAAAYAAGFVTTETQASIDQPLHHIAANVQARHITINHSNEKVGEQKNKQNKRIYKDGTFTGTGMNRRGFIDVALTIKNDKIATVEISHFAMHYSESDIVGLPDEVVQKQSAQVNNVSGATYSTQAFEDAVMDALSQAHNVKG
ncbi:FMN-binding protein [Bacillus salipaludis]|uniref:FMN-binding protein n=1 Tax=Bacillus salipaludis TaxID=2547811 RepID=A0A4R5VNQ0_9BACI|nr:FMN-binding protein [Bacillus salipaludis]MDQ6595738.1 FMN-binding protein [Bacillus salipaludis]TDK59921.1 FMN-binding protein [Bacillus salipaludis]